MEHPYELHNRQGKRLEIRKDRDGKPVFQDTFTKVHARTVRGETFAVRA